MPDSRSRLPAQPSLPDPEPAYARDAELVRSCLSGDDQAWKMLIRRYHDLVYSIPRRYGLNEDDAADVYQGVCIALWKGLSSLRSEKALTRWIEITAVRLSARLARKRRRSLEETDDRLDDMPDGVVSVAEVVERLEEQHRVRNAIERLPESCARLLKLLYLTDPRPSYDEAAFRLGLPRGSLGPSRARCVEKLRLILRRMK